MDVYFPSCNFNAASPEAGLRLSRWLRGYIAEAGCCRTETRYISPANTAIYLCQACRDVLGARIQTRSLWEFLLQHEFPWPDYSGLTVYIQDCWRDRAHPEIHSAVRNALKKMHIRALEIPENRENSRYCGNLHFDPLSARGQDLLRRSSDPIQLWPLEDQKLLLQEQADKFPPGIIVTYCNRCTQGLVLAGRQCVHLGVLAAGCY